MRFAAESGGQRRCSSNSAARSPILLLTYLERARGDELQRRRCKRLLEHDPIAADLASRTNVNSCSRFGCERGDLDAARVVCSEQSRALLDLAWRGVAKHTRGDSATSGCVSTWRTQFAHAPTLPEARERQLDRASCRRPLYSRAEQLRRRLRPLSTNRCEKGDVDDALATVRHFTEKRTRPPISTSSKRKPGRRKADWERAWTAWQAFDRALRSVTIA